VRPRFAFYFFAAVLPPGRDENRESGLNFSRPQQKTQSIQGPAFLKNSGQSGLNLWKYSVGAGIIYVIKLGYPRKPRGYPCRSCTCAPISSKM
jgi:hypothetical protein